MSNVAFMLDEQKVRLKHVINKAKAFNKNSNEEFWETKNCTEASESNF